MSIPPNPTLLASQIKASADQAYIWITSASDPSFVFGTCFTLATQQPALFRAFWQAIPYGERVPDLILDLVYYGAMPQRPYASVGWYDYDTIRELFLRSYEKSARPSYWPDRKVNSTSVCLYPEYARRSLDRRAAVVKLANDHEDGGPSDAWQANLFCLGGRYTFSIGKLGAKPPPPGTTCMLFARSILHAAGINVIGPKTPTSCSCDLGLEAELAHIGAYVRKSAFPGGGTGMPTVKPGDVFQIAGKNFKSKSGAEYSSAHVGVIVAVAGNRWTCIQGGASDHVTRRVTYTVAAASDTTWGHWYFEEDRARVGMIRAIQGYWDLDRIGDGFMMRGTPEALE